MLFMLAFACGAATACASPVDLQTDLNQQYDKKTLTLKVPALGDKLSYDIDGKMRSGKAGVGGLDDRIVVDTVKVLAQQVEIDGQRAALMVDAVSGEYRLALASKTKLTLDLPTGPPTSESVGEALRRVFATGEESQARSCHADESAAFKTFLQAPRSTKRFSADMACMPDGSRGFLVGGNM